MSSVDAQTSGEIFRKNHPMILAMNRHHAIVGARLKYSASGYKAGTVLARNSVSGLYDAYDNGASSGLDTAVGVLYFDLYDMASGVNELAQVIVKGEVYKSKLTGLDSAAETDLKARTVIDGSGTQILMF